MSRSRSSPSCDEFARLASEFDTIEELRASEAERLGELLRAQQLRQARDRVLEKLVDSIDIPLPESVIKQEADRRRELLDRQLSQSGLSKEAYLEAQEKTEEEFEAELTENATRAVKTGFVLDQLASQENLTASNEELTQYVVEQAQSMGISPDQLFQSLMQANQLQLVYVEVLRAKALDLVVSKAKITDESGNTIEPPTPVHTETITVASGDEETEESAAEQGETEK